MRSVLICDDHGLVREAMAAMLRRKWPKAQVHEASDFPTAWRLAADLPPDLCLVDLKMPGAEARDGVTRLVQAAPDARVLILTGIQDDALMLDLLDLGVAGFAPKTLSTEVIGAAIELVLAGGRYLPPRIAELSLGERADKAAAPASSHHPGPATGLSPRQVEVVRLMAEGLSNKEIGRRLDLSPATIKTHVAHVIAIVGGVNRTDAAMKARALGLI